MSFSRETEVKLLSIKENFFHIAQKIFEKIYLTPFDKTKHKENLYELPVERVCHGVQHVTHVSLYIPILINYFRGLGYPKEILELTDSQIILLQLAALFHDAGRGNDKDEDTWEPESAELFTAFLKEHGIDDPAAFEFAHYILRDVNHILNDLLQSTDSLHIMRSKKSLRLEENYLFAYLKVEDIKSYLQLVKAIRALIARQYDLKYDCSIQWNGIEIVPAIPATRQPDHPELKQKYEQAENAYALMEQELGLDPLLKNFYKGKNVSEKFDEKNKGKEKAKEITEEEVTPSPISIFSKVKNLATHKHKKIFAFSTKEDAEEFLSYVQTLFSYIEMPLVCVITSSSESYHLTLTEKHFKLLRMLIRKKGKLTPPRNDSVFKTLRADENNYFHEFIEELSAPDIYRFPKRRGAKTNYIVTGEGIFARSKDNPFFPLKKSQYTKEQKAGFTKFQSTSLASADSAVFPEVFGFNRRNVLVGVRIDEKDILYSNYLYIYDTGTWDRKNQFHYKQEAEQYHKTKVGKALFSVNQLMEFKEAVRFGTQKYKKYSESLTRVRWSFDGSSKMEIYADTLESHLLVRQYATSLAHSFSEKGLVSPDYLPPIAFFIKKDKQNTFREYTNEEYILDCLEASAIYNDETLKKEKYANQDYDFLLGLSDTQLRKELFHSDIIITLLHKGYTYLVKFFQERLQLTVEELLQPVINAKLHFSILMRILSNILRKSDLRSEAMAEYIFSHVQNIAQSKFFINTFVHSTDFFHLIENNKFTWVLKLQPYVDFTYYSYSLKNPLMVAIEYGYTDLALHLIAIGADWYNRKKTPLMSAVEQGNVAVVNALLAKNADVSFRNKSRATALLLAARYGRKDIFRILFKAQYRRAKRNTHDPERFDWMYDVDSYGYNILMYAIEYKYTDIVKALIIKYGVTLKATAPNELTLAIKYGYGEIVKFLLQEAHFILHKDTDALQVLKIAIEQQDIEILQLLLKHVDPLPNVVNTILIEAVKSENVEILQLLLLLSDSKNFPANNLLTAAAQKNNQTLILLLLDFYHTNNISFIANDALLAAIENCNAEMVKLLLAYCDFRIYKKTEITYTFYACYPPANPALVKAITTGNLEIISLLFNECAADNTIGYGALIAAIKCKQFDIAKQILEQKEIRIELEGDIVAAVDAAIEVDNVELIELFLKRDLDVNTPIWGKSLLTRSIQKNSDNAVQFFIAHSADMNAPDREGFTPLMQAIKNGNLSTVDKILQLEINIDQTNIDGETALILATKNKNKALVTTLLNHNATVGIRDRFGKTALDYAEKLNNFEMIELLSRSKHAEIVIAEATQPKTDCIALQIASLFESYAHPPLLSFHWRHHKKLAHDIAEHLKTNSHLSRDECLAYLHEQIAKVNYESYGGLAGILFKIDFLLHPEKDLATRFKR